MRPASARGRQREARGDSPVGRRSDPPRPLGARLGPPGPRRCRRLGVRLAPPHEPHLPPLAPSRLHTGAIAHRHARRPRRARVMRAASSARQRRATADDLVSNPFSGAGFEPAWRRRTVGRTFAGLGSGLTSSGSGLEGVSAWRDFRRRSGGGVRGGPCGRPGALLGAELSGAFRSTGRAASTGPRLGPSCDGAGPGFATSGRGAGRPPCSRPTVGVLGEATSGRTLSGRGCERSSARRSGERPPEGRWGEAA